MNAELVCIFDPIVTSYSRGDGKWFVQFYDRATAGFYAGTGSTCWEALAWAMDEYQVRGILKIHRVARGAEERPGELFARARGIAQGIATAFDEAWSAPRVPTVVEATIRLGGDIRHVIHATTAADTIWIDAERGPMNDAARKYANDNAVALAAGGDEPPRPREGSCFALQIDDATRANEPAPKKRRKKAK